MRNQDIEILSLVQTTELAVAMKASEGFTESQQRKYRLDFLRGKLKIEILSPKAKGRLLRKLNLRSQNAFDNTYGKLKSSLFATCAMRYLLKKATPDERLNFLAEKLVKGGVFLIVMEKKEIDEFSADAKTGEGLIMITKSDKNKIKYGLERQPMAFYQVSNTPQITHYILDCLYAFGLQVFNSMPLRGREHWTKLEVMIDEEKCEHVDIIKIGAMEAKRRQITQFD